MSETAEVWCFCCSIQHSYYKWLFGHVSNFFFLYTLMTHTCTSYNVTCDDRVLIVNFRVPPLPSEVEGSPQGIIDGLLENISHMTRMWVAQSGPRFLWIINSNLVRRSQLQFEKQGYGRSQEYIIVSLPGISQQHASVIAFMLDKQPWKQQSHTELWFVCTMYIYMCNYCHT